MTNNYLFNFCRSVPIGFRSLEIDGLAKLFSISLDKSFFDETKPFCVAQCRDSDVKLLLSRSVLLKSASEIFVKAKNYDELYEKLRDIRDHVEGLVDATSTFSIWIDSVGKKLEHKYKVEKIEELNFLSIAGSVNLSNPDVCFYILEYYGVDSCNVPEYPLEIYFGRLVGKGQRYVPETYGLKNRSYIGNTSMNPLLSFIATNAAAVAPNSFVYDPFVGTGSLLIPAAHFGAYCFGSDINYNVVYGSGRSSRHGVKVKQNNETLRGNFEQYNFKDKYIGVMLADASRFSFWRKNNNDRPFFDAIIADPPYGIREKASKVGYKQGSDHNDTSCENSDFSSVHFPSKTKYSFEEIFLDLLNFAALFLVNNGRLVYWFPIVYKDFDEDCIPRHPCLRFVSRCEQRLSSSHARLLICMEKTRDSDPVSLEERASSIPRLNFSDLSLRDTVFSNNINLKNMSLDNM